eukprot:4786225-Pleurochrysis_carterae.AAC.2
MHASRRGLTHPSRSSSLVRLHGTLAAELLWRVRQARGEREEGTGRTGRGIARGARRARGARARRGAPEKCTGDRARGPAAAAVGGPIGGSADAAVRGGVE